MRNLQNSNLAEKAKPCMYQLSISTREPTVDLLRFNNFISQWVQGRPDFSELDITKQGEEIKGYAKMLEQAYLNKTTEEFSEIHESDCVTFTMFFIYLDKDFKIMPLNQVNTYKYHGNS